MCEYACMRMCVHSCACMCMHVLCAQLYMTTHVCSKGKGRGGGVCGGGNQCVPLTLPDARSPRPLLLPLLLPLLYLPIPP